MDPIAALAFIADADTDSSDRLDSLDGLANWIARGGYVPYGAGLVEVPESHDEDGYPVRGIAAAVNVALGNADLSGLDGLGYKVVR